MTIFLTLGGHVACTQCNARSSPQPLQSNAYPLALKPDSLPPPKTSKWPDTDPTLGGTPTCTERFHCTRILTIVDDESPTGRFSAYP